MKPGSEKSDNGKSACKNLLSEMSDRKISKMSNRKTLENKKLTAENPAVNIYKKINSEICNSKKLDEKSLTIKKIRRQEPYLKRVSGKIFRLGNCMVKCLTAKNLGPKRPTAMSLTLTSLCKRLTLIVRRQQPDDKSRDTKKLNDDEPICKTVMVKYYDKEFYGKIPTVKSPTIKLMNSKHFFLLHKINKILAVPLVSCN